MTTEKRPIYLDCPDCKRLHAELDDAWRVQWLRKDDGRLVRTVYFVREERAREYAVDRYALRASLQQRTASKWVPASPPKAVVGQ